jgi:hypothetical protein
MPMSVVTKKVLCVLLSFGVLLSGCAGRDPNPISMVTPQDKELSCDALQYQIDFARDEMKRLEPKCNKVGTNALWFVGGILLLVPFFFMDVKDAEKIEYDAYNVRAHYLLSLRTNRECPGTRFQTVTDPNTGKTVSIPVGSSRSESVSPAADKPRNNGAPNIVIDPRTGNRVSR